MYHVTYKLTAFIVKDLHVISAVHFILQESSVKTKPIYLSSEYTQEGFILSRRKYPSKHEYSEINIYFAIPSVQLLCFLSIHTNKDR